MSDTDETKISSADFLSLMISQGIQRLPPGGALPDVPQGARMIFDIPGGKGDDGNSIGVDFWPPGASRLVLYLGNFGLVLTRDGVVLVLSPEQIDTVKNFQPEHTRLIHVLKSAAPTPEAASQATERLKSVGQEYFPSEPPPAT